MSNSPAIEREKCNGCGLCVEVCHCKILILVDNVVNLIEKKECVSCNHWCAQCELICPTGAITVPFDVIVEKR